MPAPIPEELIFEATVETIIDFGYASATISQIAEAAGIGEATLFRRFGSKESLLKDALKFEVEQFAREAVAYTGDLQTDLERIVRTYSRLLQRRGQLILEMINELPRRPELKEVAEIPLKGVGKVTDLLQRYQDEGQLKGDNAWEITLTLLGPILVTSSFKSLNPLIPATVEPKSYVERFLEGWRLD
jgi:AcrR family transcriptional regulator